MQYSEVYMLPTDFLKKYPKYVLLDFIKAGKRIFIFPYTVNLIWFASKVMSSPHIIEANKNTKLNCIPYIFITFLIGFWLNPSGIVWSIQSLKCLFNGGIDITELVKEQCSTEDDRLPPLPRQKD
jgi:hypothetical protein